MKTEEQIRHEIERLKLVELKGIDTKPGINKDAATQYYWNTIAERKKLEWVLKNEPVIAMYDINSIKPDKYERKGI